MGKPGVTVSGHEHARGQTVGDALLHVRGRQVDGGADHVGEHIHAGHFSNFEHGDRGQF